MFGIILGKTLEKENVDYKSKFDDIKVAEAIREKEKMVNDLIKESKLPDNVVTELFIGTLMAVQKEEGMEVKERIQELIDDRKKLVAENSGKVKGSGEEFVNDKKENKKAKKFTKEDVAESADSFLDAIN